MHTPPLSLCIQIGPRIIGGTYAVRATTAHTQLHTELALPERLVTRAEQLLQPEVALSITDPVAIGHQIGQSLFVSPLRDLLLRTARTAAVQATYVQIQFQIDVPELIALPWEWLMLGDTQKWLPALRDDYTLVRSIPSTQKCDPVLLDGPLQVLAVAACGEETQLIALKTALTDAIRSGYVNLRLMRDVETHALQSVLNSEPVHVLYCAAPIEFSQQGMPFLAIGHGIEFSPLRHMLQQTRLLRLVTFASVGEDVGRITAAPIVLAAMLTGSGIPASITSGIGLSPNLAAHFAAVCYEQLAVATPTDRAVSAGRRVLMADDYNTGLPQLILLSGHEQLFTRPESQQARGWFANMLQKVRL